MAVAMLCCVAAMNSCVPGGDLTPKSPKDLVGDWVTEYAEAGVFEGASYDRVVEHYAFSACETGYFELFLLKGDEIVGAKYVRGSKSSFRYRMVGTGDIGVMATSNGDYWKMKLADGVLVDPADNTEYTKASEAMKEQMSFWVNCMNPEWLAGQLKGKWMTADINGQSALTNDKMVLTFITDNKATVSESRADYSGSSVKWSPCREYKVQIEGNKVTLTGQPTFVTTIINEYIISYISETEIICAHKHTVKRNGDVIKVDEMELRFARVTRDYKEAALDLWECEGLSGGETYNDDNDRLEFFDDGTYKYWRKNDAGEWEEVTTREFQDYFVDGILLCTRWKNVGEDELREWWEIESLSGDEMVWTAIRQNPDGSTFRQEMRWTKIDLNLAEKIIGKWIVADLRGKPALTNEKMVTTFVSATKAIVSSSKVDFSEKDDKWNVYREDDVQIDGNKVTLTGHPNEATTLINEYVISYINDTELVGKWKHITIVSGVETVNTEFDIRLVKAKADYREAVLRLWECEDLSGGETYNDANARLEFLADGTYRYYRQDDDGRWQVVTTREFQDYFVDGTLLATRWKNVGEDELREWWEIESLSGDEMVWTALRQNPGGTTFRQEVRWTKIDLNVAEKIIGN